ncbi:bifunctional DNA-formamidopyrimidine glycosylase/DNA-(apurinic or apyrimidinic site) lyase [Acetobacteraceae bacterium KSS8]|uniref:Formamidopyrimidine-DNA glycosylase n=1 Tax=Endosaccharibacter trunci TaxID=2812733 RepID=A0ABT1W7S8_9PROT|nr:bifunctional DNA-formamidopyrimidine glycosylase/DNA-(apurinic or apyrimidinic site) lyase [Acetobacteraceae bacterium KSS8]
MPELPEVETVMRGMRAHLEGHTIVRADLRRPDLRWAMPPGLADRLRGAQVQDFRRRGKYILMRLDGGDSVLWHLGMSGRIHLTRLDAVEEVSVGPHEHVVIETEQGCRLGLVDPRRFGAVDLMPTAEEDRHRLLAGLGPEPLEAGFTTRCLQDAFAGRRTSLKAALLDQRIVAGLGNIYVCEALFRAGLSPERAAGTVSRPAIARLVTAIRAVLTEAIAAGGSSLRDYVQPDGELGYFQHNWRVYGREGEACPECPGKPGCEGVRRIVQSGRSTFFCPSRQA